MVTKYEEVMCMCVGEGGREGWRTRNTGGAVNKDEDHAPKGPSDTQNANTITVSATGFGISLVAVANDG